MRLRRNNQKIIKLIAMYLKINVIIKRDKKRNRLSKTTKRMTSFQSQRTSLKIVSNLMFVNQNNKQCFSSHAQCSQGCSYSTILSQSKRLIIPKRDTDIPLAPICYHHRAATNSLRRISPVKTMRPQKASI